VGCGGATAPADDAVTLEDSDGARIEGNLLRDAFGAGVQALGGVTDVTVRENTIRGNGRGGDETAGVLWSGENERPTTQTLTTRNLIAANAGAGVQVTGSLGGRITGHEISKNTISGNGGAGIDLVAAGRPDDPGDGTTLNDPGDGDSGGNDLLNYAVIDTAARTGDTLRVTGWATAGARVEVFAAGERFLGAGVEGSADDGDPAVSSYGPGAVNGTAQGEDSASRFGFVLQLPPGTPPVAAVVATATVGHETSEFGGAAPVSVVEPPAIGLPAVPPPSSPPAAAADRADLPCTGSGLVLVLVRASGGRVRLGGLARRASAGQAVTIRAAGRVVARARVGSAGVFATSVPLPARRLRARMRYQAFLAGDASRALKLQRRLLTASAHVVAGRLEIAGRVVASLVRPTPSLTVSRFGPCGRLQRLLVLHPGRDGRFVARLPAAAGPALYRLQTRVRDHRGGRAVFRTFSLPVSAGDSRTV
jgi:hypothetical protein